MEVQLGRRQPQLLMAGSGVEGRTRTKLIASHGVYDMLRLHLLCRLLYGV